MPTPPPLLPPLQPASHPVEVAAVATSEAAPAPAPPADQALGGEGGVGHNTNYSRPQGQNVG